MDDGTHTERVAEGRDHKRKMHTHHKVQGERDGGINCQLCPSIKI